MGSFASKPQRRDIPTRAGKTPAIKEDSLENLAARLGGIDTQAGGSPVGPYTTGGNVPNQAGGVASNATGAPPEIAFSGTDDNESTIPLDQGISPTVGLTMGAIDVLRGGSIGDSFGGVEDAFRVAGDPAYALGLAPKATDQLNALFGVTGAEAALEGARLQAAVGDLGRYQVERAQLEAEQRLQPFEQLGLDQIPAIGQSLRDLEGIQAPELLRTGDQKALAAITGELGRQGTESLQSQAQAGLAQGLADEQTLRSEAFQGGLNHNILGSEFNQALMQNIQGQIDPRFAGAVGQEAQLQSRNLAQQDLQNRLSQNNQRFTQLQAGMQRGQQARQQQFGQTGQGFSTAIQGVGQQFNQTGTAQDLANKVAQQRFANQVGSQQQNFGQLGQVLAGGQNAAVGQANAAQSTGQTISDILTQQGNALAAGGVGAAQAYGQGAQNTGNLITTGLGLFL